MYLYMLFTRGTSQTKLLDKNIQVKNLIQSETY